MGIKRNKHKDYVIEEALGQYKSLKELDSGNYSENDVFEFLPVTIDLIEDDSIDPPF